MRKTRTDRGLAYQAGDGKPEWSMLGYVIKMVAEAHGIDPDDVVNSGKRKQPIARCREVIGYVAHGMGFSYPEIGRACGGMNHSTFVFGVKKLKERMKNGQA